MIKRFEVEGFKNFENIIELDFSDVRDYKFNTQCITDRLVSKSIIYGKNSSGKTNIGLALFDIVSHLTAKNVGPKLYDYYLNANSDADYASFHYDFCFGDDLIDYRYRKTDKQEIVYEKLTLNDNVLFEVDRINDKQDFSGIDVLAPTLNWEFNDSESILKYFINNSALENEHPLRKMNRFVSSMLWCRSLEENRYIGYRTSSNDYYDFLLEDNNLKEFEQLLHTTGIKDKLIFEEDGDGNKRLYVDTKTPIPFFRTASSGTKALYTFFYWYKTAKDVSLLFLDEFDAFYHFELSEAIVSLVEKMDATQVIITSHNTNLLSNRIMRPDCYYILSDGKLTTFANATTRELREGHNLEKLYLSGEFSL